MLRLLLLRHAEATATASNGDRERPLTSKGEEEARGMGQYLQNELLWPGLTLVSPSRRTAQTWNDLSLNTPMLQREELYNVLPPHLLEVVKATAPDVKSLMLVAHNPTLHELATLLIGHGDRYAFARLQRGLPTCGLVVMDFDAQSWAEIAPRSGRLDRFITPQDQKL